MRHVGAALPVAVLAAGAAVAGEDAAPKGLLPEAEGLVVAGTVVGAGSDPVHLQLGRDIAETVIERSLSDPVGLDASDLSHSSRTPQARASRSARRSGVPPSPRVTIFVGSSTGKSSSTRRPVARSI